MSAHLRRILLAKCVVDARNKTYMRKKKQACKQIGWKPKCAKTDITNNIIDKLAYDTSYHPADFLRMNNGSKYFCQCQAQKYFTTCYDCNAICSKPKLRNHLAYINSPIYKINTSEPFISNSSNIRKQCTESNTNYRKIFNPINTKNALKFHNDRYEENSMLCESCGFLSQNVNDDLSSEISTSRSDENADQFYDNLIDNPKIDEKDEEETYAKLMYEITHEIIVNGLYTDDELNKIFKKYIEKNKKVLDMNRMLYEIYQLKLALNISDNSEEEDINNVAYQQLLNISKVRPPTPPKVLNEDRVTEKLMWYQKLDKVKNNSIGKKSVLLVDANPELRVTERDVLTSLIEADIDPEQARKIYKKLSFKSKDNLLIDTKSIQDSNENEIEKSNQFNSNLIESYKVCKFGTKIEKDENQFKNENSNNKYRIEENEQFNSNFTEYEIKTKIEKDENQFKNENSNECRIEENNCNSNLTGHEIETKIKKDENQFKDKNLKKKYRVKEDEQLNSNLKESHDVQINEQEKASMTDDLIILKNKKVQI
ncbi:TNF receptor-associated factor family protein DDB_G0272098-like isoform X3 [Apis dorsata]|nr:TNF receptor-associated factor family protein DDB_G0272098-like isoform X3 [Apis dorsata]